MDTKKCTLCGKEYPKTTKYFYRNGKFLRSRCKECEKIIRRGKNNESKM